MPATRFGLMIETIKNNAHLACLVKQSTVSPRTINLHVAPTQRGIRSASQLNIVMNEIFASMNIRWSKVEPSRDLPRGDTMGGVYCLIDEEGYVLNVLPHMDVKMLHCAVLENMEPLIPIHRDVDVLANAHAARRS